jgi:hypothetical protein
MASLKKYNFKVYFDRKNIYEKNSIFNKMRIKISDCTDKFDLVNIFIHFGVNRFIILFTLIIF